MSSIEKRENDLERATAINAIQMDEGYHRQTSVNSNNIDISTEKATVVNENTLNARSVPTTVNGVLQHVEHRTMLNQEREYGDRSTAVNRQPLDNQIDISTPVQEHIVSDTLTGTIIDGYKIGDLMNTRSGEAQLYKCTNDKNEELVIKYFQRPLSEDDLVRHDELVNKLKEIRDGVVRITTSGLYQGRLYEIMQYYNAGSLKDRMKKKLFTEEEIKTDVLPQLIGILKRIHEQGIYHADIKPENIMYKSKGKKDLVLIDFGVSKVSVGGGTTFVTIIGGTADYQAPEMFRGILHPETDYYALGITLFELITGRTPTAYLLNMKDVERNAILNAIPHPDGMSDDFYRLVYYLTFDSVRNRDDRRNHNNRWVYEEVNQWLVDGNPSWSIGGKEDLLPDINIRFGGKLYATMNELLFAMSGDWDRGRDFLIRPSGGLITELGKNASRNKRLLPLSTEVKSFIDAAIGSEQSSDVVLFEFIYQFGNDIKPIFWKGNAYKSIDELGQAVFRSLRASNTGSSSFFSFFSEGLLDLYVKQNQDVSNEDKTKIQALKELSFDREDAYTMYRAAYILMNEPEYFLSNGASIKTIAGLKAYLVQEGSKGNLLDFINLCKEFVYESGKDRESFQAWEKANLQNGRQASNVAEELVGLPSIAHQRQEPVQLIDRHTPNTKEEKPQGEEKVKKKFSFWGLILGIIILAITVAPFTMFILSMSNGNTNIQYHDYRYVFLFATLGMPIFPLLVAKLICIPRNSVTNTCFKVTSVICRILKYDTIIVASTIVYQYYSNRSVSKYLTLIQNCYSWILRNVRALFHFSGSDEILTSFAEKVNASQYWFNDVVRLLVIFIIYTIFIAILRKRKSKQ